MAFFPRFNFSRRTWFAIGASVALHGVLAGAIIQHRITTPRRAPRVAESADTVLALAPIEPQSRAQAPSPPPATPPPEPPPPPPPVVAAIALSPVPEVEPQRPPQPEPTPVFSVKPQEDQPKPAETAARPAPDSAPSPIQFAGLSSAAATRVVYVVDASGAMASTLSFAFAELERSVSRLNESQRFQVILCRDAPKAAGTEVFDESGLVRASPAKKLELARWLNELTPSGKSDPLPAISAALRLNPELVLVLTRSIKRSGRDTSWGAGVAATLATLDSQNPIEPRTMLRPAVIKTVQFLEEDPTGLLSAIAEAHGDGPGSYRVVGLEELKAGAAKR